MSEKTMKTNSNKDPETVIKVKDLYKVYRIGENRVRALNGVSFSIKRGEFWDFGFRKIDAFKYACRTGKAYKGRDCHNG